MKRVELSERFHPGLITAIDLIGRFDPHLREIVPLSIAVSRHRIGALFIMPLTINGSIVS